jgi:lysophosphatidate acyltransferase
MDLSCLYLTLLFLVVGLLCVISPTARYVFKFYLYSMCLIWSSFIGSLIQLVNAKRTPNNALLIFEIFKKTLFWTGLKYEQRDLKYLDTDEPCIIIANHQSALDVNTMGYMWAKDCVVILKKSLRFLPGFNICAYLCNSIYIDRINKEKAHRSIASALDHIKNKKHKIFIFPEGTRNSNDDLLPFKKGAFILAKEANVPIMPVVFSRYKHFLNYEEGQWDYGGRVIVKALKPIYPQDYSSIEELSDECRKIMKAELDELDKELNTSSKTD